MAKGTPSIAVIALLVAACGTPTPTPTQASQGQNSVGPSTAAVTTPPPPSSVTPSASGSGPPIGSGAPTTIDPANFVAIVDNPWFPLTPGIRFTYTGTKDGEKAVDVFEVARETKVIDGVTCLVIRDNLSLDGTLEERTEDWYVQDRTGNVWYFGEATAELDRTGKVVSTEGSWTAGLDSAAPGIFMPANPQVGQSFQQEFYNGHAEDHFVVLLITARVRVPAGTYTNALLTAEWTPLEPNVLGEKFYAKGVGLVKELDVAGGNESFSLTKVQRP